MPKGYDDVLGKGRPAGGHTSASQHDRPYSHFCRPEPMKEMPWVSADADASKDGQKGMLDDSKLPRANSGAVIGSQLGAKPNPGGRVQRTQQNEWNDLSQWDKQQESTYPEKRDNDGD